MLDLDVKTLRLLVAVAEHRNMARAAEQEHIVASAISKRIGQLEAALDAPLFVRSRRGLQPTAAGAALLEHARSMLFTVERIEQDVAAVRRGGRGRVKLLASASAMAESLLDDIAAFMRARENRDIQVDIEERVSQDLVREVGDGLSSIGVCWDRADLQALQCARYREDRLALVVHPQHPLARRRRLRFEETLEHEHVGLPPTTAVHRMLRADAAKAGRDVVYRVIVSTFDAAMRAVAANLGVSVIPTQVSGPYESLLGICSVPLSDAWARRRFVICYRDLASLSPAARRLVEHLSARAAAAG